MTEAGAEARRFGRSAGLLSAGVGAAGLLTYSYFALASRSLDPTEYGEVVVLWSAVFVSISVLYRPVEQLLSRTIAERSVRGEPTGPALRVAASIQLGVGLATAAVVLALRDPLRDNLLAGSDALYWIMFAALIGFGASFFARGFLAGSRRFSLLAGLLLAEASSRAAFAFLVAVGVTEGQTAVALGVAAAPLFSLLVVPLAFGRRAARLRAQRPAPPAEERGDADMSLVHGGGFAAAVFVVMLSEQVLLNGGPLLERGFEGAAAAGFIFNVLMLARAPLVVFQGVATSLLPHLTRLRSRGAGGAEAFRLSLAGTLRAVGAFTAVVAVAVAVAGPDLMQLAFGDDFSYDRAGLLIVTAGMGLYLAATTLSQAAIAQGRVRAASACWATCAIAFLVWCLLPVLDEPRRIEIGFTGAAALLALLLRPLHLRPGERLEPDSPEELEARLAAAEEVA
jgi:O-antigen/teichoic acid export membrane protein